MLNQPSSGFCRSFPYGALVHCSLGVSLVAVFLPLDSASAQVEKPAVAVEVWTTTQGLEKRLERQPPLEWIAGRAANPKPGDVTISVDSQQRHQRMLGMGSSLEHASCFNLSQLTPEDRRAAITRLVNPEGGIGMNLMRICIGTPDFTGDPWYSYDDLPAGESDPELQHFSIDKDRRYVIPILQQALAENPELLFFASPWSPPGWMKSSGSLIGGHLLPEHYPAYAQYFVRFLTAYQAAGIPIHAITVQNEPGVDRQYATPKWHYPSCRWTAAQERDFIRDHLGPALHSAGLDTKIWCYDHNYNVAATPDGDDPGIAYPRLILQDPAAAAFVDGVAFHGYAGKPAGMSEFAKEFPEVPIYFTEGSMFGISGAEKIVELLTNGASSYNAWVTMIDTDRKPNNGPFQASRTLVMLDNEKTTVDYRLDYYLYGQFMKFIERGAVRIGTACDNEKLAHVAFQNPAGEIVLVVVNNSRDERGIDVESSEKSTRLNVAPRSVTTLRWNPN
jgi:glucosylceramidase